MHRAAATRIILAGALLLVGATGTLAQTVQSPLIPRGSLFIRLQPSATTVEGTYGPDGTGSVPLGHSFTFPSIGTAEVPALVPTAERFGALAGTSETPALRVGGTVARFSADERVLPIQVSYGILDRLTVGVTIPVIRKRLETLLRVTPDGANVGLSPFSTGAGSVPAFLGDAQTALEAVRTAVDDRCLQLGEEAPECLQGRALVGDADSFLTDLDAAYQDEELFPLEGSMLGDAISTRWGELASSFTDWGATGPELLPLASDPMDQATFESLVVGPAWPEGGFPLETPDAVLGLGDVEVEAALGLTRPAPPPPIPGAQPGIQLSSAAVATFRFGTGSADSLRTVSPIDPPRGVSGFSVRGIADLLLTGRLSRFAVLGVVEAGWNGTRETTLLAPDLSRAFAPGGTRAEVRWSPGSHLRASVTPRFRFGPGLSLGAGWQFLRREPDEYAPVADDDGSEPPELPSPGEAFTQQRVAVELRYTTMQAPLDGAVSFPFEVLFRGSRSFAGGGGAAVESRVEAMVRFRFRE